MPQHSAPMPAGESRHDRGVPVDPASNGGDPSAPAPRRKWRWITGGVVLAGFALLKLKSLLFLAATKFKPLLANPFEGFGASQFLMAGASMLVSLAAYAWKMGLPFAIGFIILLVAHEVGHALMIRAKGLRAGAMVFIPFVGGAVTLRRQPRSAYVDAQIGLAGPVAGALASWICVKIFDFTSDPLYLAIALAGFVLNLFNLTPIAPLDGGRIAAAITKWMWVLGALIVLWLIVVFENPYLLILLLLSVFQIWRAIGEERRRRFYDVSFSQRAGIAAVYFMLVAFLSYQSLMGYALLEALRQL